MDYKICAVCGTQFDVTGLIETCIICDDPRQYVPPTGPSFTTLAEMRACGKYKNVFATVRNNPYIQTISTTPKFGIGQRAILIKTKQGNVLWDCVAYLDEDTISNIKALGGLDAIVVSHPHFYTTTGVWAEAFNCKVYTSIKDQEWLQRRTERHVLFSDAAEIPLSAHGVEVVVAGGHFPGSTVLCHENRLYCADTLQIVPSGLYFKNRPPGTITFSFMWSYPNQIPLAPEEVAGVWNAVKHLQFQDAHGGFPGREVYGNAKARARESARIVIGRLRGDEGLLE